MKTLILKPSSLGDVVQALPVLRLLKRAEPAGQFYWWLSSDLVSLLEGDPDLAGIFPFQRRGWANGRSLLRFARSIAAMRACRFDRVLDLQGLARSSLVAWLASGSCLIGLEDWREGAPALYDISIPRPSRLTHAVDWYLQVVKRLEVPVDFNFDWMPHYPAAVQSIQKQTWPGRKRWIICVPGARWANKRWPIESYTAVVRTLAAANRDVGFVVLGNSGDSALGSILAQTQPERCLDLTGKTSLPEMVEWIRMSELVLTNDTGPMHVAAALRKPVVAMFGPTEPRRTGPYLQGENVLQHPVACAPCLKPHCDYIEPLACLRGISAATVCARAQAILNNQLPRRVD